MEALFTNDNLQLFKEFEDGVTWNQETWIYDM